MFNIKELYELFGVDVKIAASADTVINSVDHDTRRLKPNSLYVAIKGDNLDGHDFIKDAVSKGAVACLVEKQMPDISVPQIVVNDAVQAYGKLASYWRTKIKYPLVAVTGSNGKTTTKDMLYSVLSFKNVAVKTDGNFNNLIGVPYTILSFPLDADFGIVEMGMNAKGEIKKLAKITKANFGLITNIGRAHIGLLGSMNDVFEAKMELFDELLSSDGGVCVNLSDPMISKWFMSKKIKTPFITYGLEKDAVNADVKLSPLGLKAGLEKFNVTFKGSTFEAEISVVGIHNVQNACSAIATGILMGLDPKDCVKAVANYKGSKLRSSIVEKDDVTYFVDCYNANPDSMRAALSSMHDYNVPGKKIVVLGDMLELESLSDELHYEIGSFVGTKGFDVAFFYGNYSQKYADGFISVAGKQKSVNVYPFGSMQKLKDDIKAVLKKGDLVVVKGSRGMKLEEIF